MARPDFICGSWEMHVRQTTPWRERRPQAPDANSSLIPYEHSLWGVECLVQQGLLNPTSYNPTGYSHSVLWWYYYHWLLADCTSPEEHNQVLAGVTGRGMYYVATAASQTPRPRYKPNADNSGACRKWQSNPTIAMTSLRDAQYAGSGLLLW